jgi:hypothetical protein
MLQRENQGAAVSSPPKRGPSGECQLEKAFFAARPDNLDSAVRQNQHGAWRVTDHTLSDAADENVAQARPSMGGSND